MEATSSVSSGKYFLPAGADIFTDFTVLEEQLKGVGASSAQGLLIRATVVKLKHSQVIAYYGERANLTHNSQLTRDFKQHKITLISKLH